MLIVLRVLAALGLIVLVLAGAGFLLPREVTVQRSVMIAAPPEAVFPHLNSLQKFAAWSPWHGRDPAMVQSFSGPEAGVGNRMEWRSDDPSVGSGSQVITRSEPNARVETALDFGPNGAGTAWQALAPVDGGTAVTWGLGIDMGPGPIGRYMGLMMDRWIGPDYESGLARLKAIVETE